MENKIYTTDLNNRVSLVERIFYYDQNEYTEVLAYDKFNDIIEYIGTSYNKMQYYYNKNYIVFAKNEDVEFVFDTRRFCFITNEMEKEKAFNDILKSAQGEYTKEESNLKIETEERYLIKKYYLGE